MKKDSDPAKSAADPATPPVPAEPSLRRRVAALMNTTALLATTALIAAIEPKSPPFKGD